jgi:hypothetical protein
MARLFRAVPGTIAALECGTARAEQFFTAVRMTQLGRLPHPNAPGVATVAAKSVNLPLSGVN